MSQSTSPPPGTGPHYSPPPFKIPHGTQPPPPAPPPGTHGATLSGTGVPPSGIFYSKGATTGGRHRIKVYTPNAGTGSGEFGSASEALAALQAFLQAEQAKPPGPGGTPPPPATATLTITHYPPTGQ